MSGGMSLSNINTYYLKNNNTLEWLTVRSEELSYNNEEFKLRIGKILVELRDIQKKINHSLFLCFRIGLARLIGILLYTL